MLTSKRVCYVVDDDADDQEIFLMAVEVIENSELQFKMFSRAKDLLDELSNCNNYPDYVFMDINMPEMDGFECLAQLRTLNIPNELKLIVVSTSGSQHDMNRAKSLGAESYIVKPYSISEYSQILRQHLL